MQSKSHRRSSKVLPALTLVCALLPLSAAAQAVAQPKAASVPQAAQAQATGSAAAKPLATGVPDTRVYGAKDVSARPYSAFIPAPLYPSSPRLQKQFTIEYVYDYAQSNYTPPVALPVTGRGGAKRDSPEAAVAAFFSAMRQGDYEGWLQCFDDDSRKALEARTKEHPEGAEFWRASWRKSFTGKNVLLVDRLETVNYIILDLKVIDEKLPGTPDFRTITLANHSGAWLVTNEFANDGFSDRFRAPAESPQKLKQDQGLVPMQQLGGPAHLLGEAQADFYARHAFTNAVTKVVE